METGKQLIIDPNPLWFIKLAESHLDFPPLVHNIVDDLKLPVDSLHDNRIHVGGSWNAFCNERYYAERCEILEHQYMPYDLNSKYFKVRNGVLLWPRINLSAYTYLLDPQRVFIWKNDCFVAELHFLDDRIVLNELKSKNDDDDDDDGCHNDTADNRTDREKLVDNLINNRINVDGIVAVAAAEEEVSDELMEVSFI